MATKKSASKKTAEGASAPAKTAAKKTPAKKTAAKQVDEVGTAAQQPSQTKAHTKPSHHDISVQAYLLWERDGKKHGHHDHYWHQAERELHK